MSHEQNPPLKEEFRSVVGYEGKYEVSNYGRVASLDYGGTGKWRLMKLNKNKAGYLQVMLANKKKRKNHKVHRLVASAFIPNPENKPQIDHEDGERDNNNVNNLRWCTPKENSNFPLARANNSKAQMGKKRSDEHRANMSKANNGNSNALKENSLRQKWKRAYESGDFPYLYPSFIQKYNDPTRKDHAHVRALAEKYTI